MPRFIKHVGQTIDTNKKCVVVFRTLPDDATNCLIVETESLPPDYHDYLIKAVESATAQTEMEFYTFASRSTFMDGTNMLQSLHKNGWMRKRRVDEIEMIPAQGVAINLKDLNSQISQVAINEAEQKTKTAGVLSDSDIANQMRSQAAFFKKEAERLLSEANALDPVASVSESPVVPEILELPVKKGPGRPKKK
jgi:hypothetical protein